jgi:hydrogenase maturation factor
VFKLSDEQVLSMSSTGTILAAVHPEGKKEVEETLSRTGLKANFIGEFTKSKKQVLVKANEEMIFPKDADDPYARILSGKV